MYQHYNPNPRGRNVGDCTIRAVAKATGQTWERAYMGVSLEGYKLGDMPSADVVWGEYLRKLGFHRRAISNDYPDRYTVRDFCADHPRGVYVLSLSGHVVAVEDGDYFDTWDSGDRMPVYYWTKEKED